MAQLLMLYTGKTYTVAFVTFDKSNKSELLYLDVDKTLTCVWTFKKNQAKAQLLMTNEAKPNAAYRVK